MSSKNDQRAADARSAGGSYSLALRLTLWYAATAFLLIAGATGFLYWTLLSNLDREDDEFLADKVHLLRALLRDRPEEVKGLRQEVEWEASAREYGQVFVRLLDPAGGIVMETPGMADALPAADFPDPLPADREPGRASEIHPANGKSYRVLSVRAAVGPSGSAERTIQVALDRTYEEALLTRYRHALALALGLALLVCAAVGFTIARRGLRPLAAITRTAQQIRSTTLHERIALPGLPRELSVLAVTFNGMLHRLEESFRRLGQFSADIAHELRTPVNNLRGEIEVAQSRPRAVQEYRELLGSCLEECGRLGDLIDSLLFLARAESPRAQLAREALDLRRELATVRDFYEAAAAEAGVSLSLEAGAGLVASADRTLLQRAVGNLIRNALAHTPRGGSIRLSAERQDGLVSVTVSDTGKGIAAEHLPHIFDRFYRADSARTAGNGRVGLGLAIVKSIVTLHGGSVAAESREGVGTRITLNFPAAPVPSDTHRHP